MTQVEPDPNVGDGPQPNPTEEEDQKSREYSQEETMQTREPGRDHTKVER